MKDSRATRERLASVNLTFDDGDHYYYYELTTRRSETSKHPVFLSRLWPARITGILDGSKRYNGSLVVDSA